MIDVFLDANVLFSASWAEDSGVTALWRIGCIELVTSAYALDEAIRNLNHPDQLQRLRSLMEHVKLCGEPQPTGHLFVDADLPDKDLPILLAAIESNAAYLVTGDRKHFGAFMGTTIEGVMICSPRDLLDRFKAAEDDQAGSDPGTDPGSKS